MAKRKSKPERPSPPPIAAKKVVIVDGNREHVLSAFTSDAGQFRIFVAGQAFERVGTTDAGVPIYAPAR